MSYVIAAGGLVLLFLGGEMLVRGGVAVARRLGVSPLIIGLTIVGFGTSTPELTVSLDAALVGSPDIALGNVVGSNIANILLILGIGALINPLSCPPALVTRDGTVMVLASLLLVGLGLWGAIVAWQGALMVAALAAYVGASYVLERRSTAAAALHAHEAEEFEDIPLRAPIALLAIGLGLIALVLGASLLVDGAIAIARGLGIPEAVIGLTLVAVGTSLPELATTVVAAMRGHADVAVGNVVGSNIFNILGILGVTGMVATIPFGAAMTGFDLWVMLGVAIVALPFMATGQRIGRREGVALLVAYGAYIAVLAGAIPGFAPHGS